MNTSFKMRATAIAVALMAFSVASAAVTKTEYKTSEKQIKATYKADRAACGQYSGNAKDICIAEAKGKQKTALADLEYSYTDKPSDNTKALIAHAEADYDVAREKCDDMTGNNKDVCIKQAKANEASAKADAKMDKKVSAAQRDASEDKRDADYKVAIEKCDALASDAKKDCVASAKSTYGK